MPREIPDCPSEKPNPPRGTPRSYDIELITPMFGGGVKPRVTDPSFSIRPTAIRGQLQFWWRATVGAQHAALNDLREAHSDIWGSTERASSVQVLVENVRASELVPCARYEKQGDRFRSMPSWNSPFSGQTNALHYAIFPFKGRLSKDRTKIEEEPASSIMKATFRLTLRCPSSVWSQVELAVRAWINFGGIGSRTRRGCGALYCQGLSPTRSETLAEWFKTFGPTSTAVRMWPTLRLTPLVRNETQQPLTAWERLIAMYRFFRQGVDFARNPGPGRSRYPEPETIRRITQRRMHRHVPWDDMPDGFPRAELGLPIVFHFKDEDKDEPPTTTLNPFVDGKALERMASPLILKPLALEDKTAIPLILCLNTPGVQQVELQDDGKNSLTPRHAVPIQDRAFAVEGSPLHGLTSNGSALEAFLAFAREEGFAEVMQ